MIPSAKIVTPILGIDECVLNVDLKNLDIESPAFKNVEAFLAMVIPSPPSPFLSPSKIR